MPENRTKTFLALLYELKREFPKRNFEINETMGDFELYPYQIIDRVTLVLRKLEKILTSKELDKFHEITDRYFPPVCPREGAFTGYKYAISDSGPVIVVLDIPEDARRSSGVTSKCRCDKAFVRDIYNVEDGKNINSASSFRKTDFKYVVGCVVEEPNYNTNRWKECSEGIHFFMEEEGVYDFIVHVFGLHRSATNAFLRARISRPKQV